MKYYKSLSKFEKLAEVQELNPSKCERHNMAVYLKALWLNNTEILDYYESFGDAPNKFFSNKRAYERGLLFGYSEIQYNEYGWLDNAELIEKEQIDIISKGSNRNYITIGKGLNGNWTYGMSYSTGNGGGGYRADVWGKIIPEKQECIIEALQELKQRHLKEKQSAEKYGDSSHNYQSAVSEPVVKEVNKMLDELTGKVAVQLELF